MTTQKRGRGRPKGSQNKPKAEGPGPGLKGSGKPNQRGVGDNSELNDAEKKSLMLDHARKVRLIEAEIAELQTSRKKIIGAAKADGIPAKDIKDFNALRDKTDKEILAQQQKIYDWTRWQGRGVQGDLLDYLKQAPAVEARAESEGFEAGVEGQEPKCDHTGAAHEAWMRGWHTGKDALASALAKKSKEEDEDDENVTPFSGKDAAAGEQPTAAT